MTFRHISKVLADVMAEVESARAADKVAHEFGGGSAPREGCMTEPPMLSAGGGTHASNALSEEHLVAPRKLTVEAASSAKIGRVSSVFAVERTKVKCLPPIAYLSLEPVADTDTGIQGDTLLELSPAPTIGSVLRGGRLSKIGDPIVELVRVAVVDLTDGLPTMRQEESNTSSRVGYAPKSDDQVAAVEDCASFAADDNAGLTARRCDPKEAARIGIVPNKTSDIRRNIAVGHSSNASTTNGRKKAEAEAPASSSEGVVTTESGGLPKKRRSTSPGEMPRSKVIASPNGRTPRLSAIIFDLDIERAKRHLTQPNRLRWLRSTRAL